MAGVSNPERGVIHEDYETYLCRRTGNKPIKGYIKNTGSGGTGARG